VSITVSPSLSSRDMQTVVCERMPRLLEGQWYHLAVVHVRSHKETKQPVLHVFLDGKQCIVSGHHHGGGGAA
jgi:hypothetical protein